MKCEARGTTHAASLAIYLDEEGGMAIQSAYWMDIVIVPASLTSVLASHASQERGFRRAVNCRCRSMRKQ